MRAVRMKAMTDKPIPRIAYLQLAPNIVLFGLSWPIIKIGLEAASPLWFAAARATLSAATAFALLAGLGRLAWPPRADWPIVLSVGALQLACFFAFSNLGLQSLPAGRSSVLAYTAILWVVPLSLLVGEKVGWRAVARRAAGRGRHRRPGRSAALRLERQGRGRGAMSGCCWRASPGRSPWSISAAIAGGSRRSTRCPGR